MNRPWDSAVRLWRRLLLLSSVSLFTGAAGATTKGPATPAPPQILYTHLFGKILVVAASIPQGWQAVALDSQSPTNAGGWVPRAVLRSGLGSGRVFFNVPAGLHGQKFRVRGVKSEPLPSSYYAGRRSFGVRKSTTIRADQGSGLGFNVAANGSLATAGSTTALPATATPARTVTESDIWKLDGDRLYYFNQLRGLQVIDVTLPDAPVVRGTLSLPAVGEQMYLLDANHVVLLARSGCGDAWQSQVLVVDVSATAPHLVATLPVEGWLQESRLVGTALYVASQVYRADTNNNWTWGTVVSALDLAQPASPVARPTLWYAGSGNAVMASDRWLCVATVDYGAAATPLVRLIDISSPDGTMTDLAGLPTAGPVADKFSMDVTGEVFRVVTSSYVPNPTNAWTGAWATTLETFSLANPAAPQALGRLVVPLEESLFAARFDGPRAYLSTYQQIDPLWVVDLSDPTQPRIAGAVEVPGYSTYIQPMGDRLLTLGTETNRVAVSLFDVSDPTQPGLLSRAVLGENYSWSEAGYDEKALTILSDLGLILVPYEGDTTNGWANRIQLLDLSTNSLTTRGVIEHRFQPRRATAHAGRILSVSGEALITVDATDQDHPATTADTELAWSVNRVFIRGDYLLELATGNAGWATVPCAVRVTLAAQPDLLVGEFDLGDLPVVGAAVRDDKLFLLQSPNAYGWPIYWGLGVNGGVSSGTNLVLTVLDVSGLPVIRLLGQTAVAPSGSLNTGGSFQPVWVATNQLVWVGTGASYFINPLVEYGSVGALPANALGVSFAKTPAGPVLSGPSLTATTMTLASLAPSLPSLVTGVKSASPASVASGALTLPYWWPWWNNGGVSLLAFDVSDPANPFLTSSFNLNPTNSWGFSAPYTAQGVIYFTHEQSDYTAAAGGLWRVSDWLDVIDYSVPTAPTPRPAINVAGQLAGLSADGALLYLLGNESSGNGGPALNVCAYDGVIAYLAATMPLPQTWPQPVVVHGDTIFLGRADPNSGTNNWLEAWELSASRQFLLQAKTGLSQPASALAVFGSLVAAQNSNGALMIFDASSASALRPCGQGNSPSCLWSDLNRADGSLTAGLWIPLDDYGTARVVASPAAASVRTKVAPPAGKPAR